jgi:hypothetical protein
VSGGKIDGYPSIEIYQHRPRSGTPDRLLQLEEISIRKLYPPRDRDVLPTLPGSR